MRPAQALSVIEAAYRIELSNVEWQQELAAAGARALGSSQGAMVFQYEAAGGWVNPSPPVLHGLSPEFVRDFFNQPDSPPEAGQAMAQQFRSARFRTVRALIEKLGIADSFGAILDRHGVDDVVCINGLDPTGRGCMLCIVDRVHLHSARTMNLWYRLAAHVSAGNRLRSTLETLENPDPDPMKRAEAVLAPNGKVEHAVGSAEPRSARETLRDALTRIDAARSEKDDAGRSVELWRGLVAGRWSLVEHFERDGRRYYLAHKNDPELSGDRALTTRERQVIGYAELGHSNKLIGYELGLAPSTISALLGRARKKVRT